MDPFNSYDIILASSSEDEAIVDFVQNYILNDEDDAETSERIPRSRAYIPREREVSADRLWNDYFAEDPKYTPRLFKRRFRMRRQLFLRITEGISSYSPDNVPNYFQFFRKGCDAVGRPSLTIIQKITAALRQLAYGTCGDMWDEYLQMSETTAINCLDNFCKCVMDLYKGEYLRRPTEEDIARLYRGHEQKHGFRGMLGSIDCMHWDWKNCPTGWQGVYTRGDHKKPTIMLEAVASYDLWIWHAFFGMAGSNNDINVLKQSPLFDQLKRGNSPPASFVVNGHEYSKGYYLADGIYPEWATLIKGWTNPTDEPRAKFTRFQSSARKDIERAFGVLQSRFNILKVPSRSMSVNKMMRVMYCCLVLHNMIQEDNGFVLSEDEERDLLRDTENRPQRVPDRGRDHATISREIRDKRVHDQLTHDLVQHIWNLPATFRREN